MTERIKAHLDALFQGAPKTRQIEDMKKELLAGCLDKYEDLTANGTEPEAAYTQVIEGICDVSELIGNFENANVFDPAEMEDKRKKRAAFVTLGICAFFLAFISLIISEHLFLGEISAAFFFLFIGIGVALLIYGSMTTKVKYEKTDDSMVENYKEKITKGKSGNSMASLASSTLWSTTVLVYLAASFIARGWPFTWLLFLAAAGIQCLVTAKFYPARQKSSYYGAFWCFTVLVYFLLSFITNKWQYTWLVFPLALAAQQAFRFFYAWRSEQ